MKASNRWLGFILYYIVAGLAVVIVRKGRCLPVSLWIFLRGVFSIGSVIIIRIIRIRLWHVKTLAIVEGDVC
jgi:hypothetical protein